ncbi:MAG TPA: ABC-F family ATP-binding cassette domain-containing protein [Ktedonobacterales bacterium]
MSRTPTPMTWRLTWTNACASEARTRHAAPFGPAILRRRWLIAYDAYAMSIATLTGVARSFGAQQIFSDVAFRIENDDRIGLVGPNGAGKTTLLALIGGTLEPDAGNVALAVGTRAGYLAQDSDFLPDRSLYDEMLSVFDDVRAWEDELAALGARLAEPELLADQTAYGGALARYAELQARFEHAGGYTMEPRVRQVLDGLGFSREQQAAPAGHLSGGQRTRAALGKLLLQEPDLLLLDEPTNHLDLAALEWLETYLTTWHGAVVVVSHDRYFLDRVTRRTIEVADGRVTLYPGNYTTFVRLRAERVDRWTKEYAAQQEHIARTEDFIRRYKAGQRSKEARGRQTLLDRLERVERPPATAGLHFSLHVAIQSGEIVLRADQLVVGYAAGARDPVAGTEGDVDETRERRGAGLRVLLPEAQVRRGERIGLIGPNGAGKTTILRTIVGQIPALDGQLALGHNVQVGYYAQTHEGLNPRATLIDEIRRASQLSEEGARTFLGRFLFTGDDVFKPIGALSGGERSRVALAKLTLQGANFLVLDEPTNHLDLPARQVLEGLLNGYDGTLLFVSHDRYFVDALATRLWVLEGGRIASYDGNYSVYRARQTRAAAMERTARARADAQEAALKSALRSGGSARERTAERVESEIATAEAQLAKLEASLGEASAAADVVRITALATEYEGERARLDALYEEWAEKAG